MENITMDLTVTTKTRNKGITTFDDAMSTFKLKSELKQNKEGEHLTKGSSDKKGDFQQIVVELSPADKECNIRFKAPSATLRVRLYADNTIMVLGHSRTRKMPNTVHLETNEQYLLKTVDAYGASCIAVDVWDKKTQAVLETDMKKAQELCVGKTFVSSATMDRGDFYTLTDALAMWFIENDHISEETYVEAKDASFNKNKSSTPASRAVPEASTQEVIDQIVVDAEDEVPL
jgi:hypothetical protein